MSTTFREKLSPIGCHDGQPVWASAPQGLSTLLQIFCPDAIHSENHSTNLLHGPPMRASSTMSSTYKVWRNTLSIYSCMLVILRSSVPMRGVYATQVGLLL